VPLPFFLRDAVFGLGLPRQVVGAFLGIYIIVYGQMQAYTPQVSTTQAPTRARAASAPAAAHARSGRRRTPLRRHAAARSRPVVARVLLACSW
jgi:hypothetical protein